MCNRTINNKIKLDERTLRIVHNERQSTFEELLGEDKSFIIHRRKKLAIKMDEAHSNIAPAVFLLKNDFFKKRNNLPLDFGEFERLNWEPDNVRLPDVFGGNMG